MSDNTSKLQIVASQPGGSASDTATSDKEIVKTAFQLCYSTHISEEIRKKYREAVPCFVNPTFFTCKRCHSRKRQALESQPSFKRVQASGTKASALAAFETLLSDSSFRKALLRNDVRELARHLDREHKDDLRDKPELLQAAAKLVLAENNKRKESRLHPKTKSILAKKARGLPRKLEVAQLVQVNLSGLEEAIQYLSNWSDPHDDTRLFRSHHPALRSIAPTFTTFHCKRVTRNDDHCTFGLRVDDEGSHCRMSIINNTHSCKHDLPVPSATPDLKRSVGRPRKVVPSYHGYTDDEDEEDEEDDYDGESDETEDDRHVPGRDASGRFVANASLPEPANLNMARSDSPELPLSYTSKKRTAEDNNLSEKQKGKKRALSPRWPPTPSESGRSCSMQSQVMKRLPSDDIMQVDAVPYVKPALSRPLARPAVVTEAMSRASNNISSTSIYRQSQADSSTTSVHAAVSHKNETSAIAVVNAAASASFTSRSRILIDLTLDDSPEPEEPVRVANSFVPVRVKQEDQNSTRGSPHAKQEVREPSLGQVAALDNSVRRPTPGPSNSTSTHQPPTTQSFQSIPNTQGPAVNAEAPTGPIRDLASLKLPKDIEGFLRSAGVTYEEYMRLKMSREDLVFLVKEVHGFDRRMRSVDPIQKAVKAKDEWKEMLGWIACEKSSGKSSNGSKKL